MSTNPKDWRKEDLEILYEQLELKKAGVNRDTFLVDPWSIFRGIGLGEIEANTSWIETINKTFH